MRELIAGMICAALCIAPAVAQTTKPVYDGTGSQFVPRPEDDANARKDWGDNGAKIAADVLKKNGRSTQAADLFDLGSIHAQGLAGQPVDLNLAYGFFERSADKGDIRARSLLCVDYLIGLNRPVDFATAMKYCTRLNEKEPARMFANAYDYEMGLSGPKDEEAALVFHFEAAKASSGDSMDRLGVMLRDKPGKAEVARAWFRQGAMQGSAAAMYHLAQMTESGLGGVQDKALAGWLYTNAARRGDKAAQTWLTAQTTPPVLPRVALADGKTTLLTETVTKDGVKTTLPFSFTKVANAQDLYPKGAALTLTEGTASFHCYISATHSIDICLPTREFPVGFAFGIVLQSVLRSQLSAAPQDLRGRPTAESVYVVTFNWQMD